MVGILPEEQDKLFSSRGSIEGDEGPLLSEIGIAFHDVLVQDLQYAAQLCRLLLQLRLWVPILLQDCKRVVRGLQAVHASVDEVFVNFNLE